MPVSVRVGVSFFFDPEQDAHPGQISTKRPPRFANTFFPPFFRTLGPVLLAHLRFAYVEPERLPFQCEFLYSSRYANCTPDFDTRNIRVAFDASFFTFCCSEM